MNYRLHPEAAAEHRDQIATYEREQKGLGRRYHREFLAAVALACEMPRRPRVIRPPDIRSVGLHVFRFSIVYREIDGVVQVLAVAHHRRRAGYWAERA
ncbi:type II toxin-antitoxin system RelE/ParE family toxin [Nevskia sp.]|uniref:type II toxin-antitoxin system RelE/ParE family toxin n=1 Tax=Nevskia sp. TaxID=1929292 RepID=UPI0025D4CD62|nr:type II toxin-antitoxin system RelE/ParE family toxin [Nevskia sp.]